MFMVSEFCVCIIIKQVDILIIFFSKHILPILITSINFVFNNL